MANTGWAAVQATLRLRSTANYFQHIFHQARHTALTQGVDIAICASPDGRQCAPTSRWTDGWLMFINKDSDAPPRRDPGEPVLTSGGKLRGVAVSANRSAFVMRPYGQRSTAGTLELCASTGARSGTAVIVSYIGKPRTSRTLPSGAAVPCR